MNIDLHIHSKDCSDGKMTIPEIIEYASGIGVKLISITDHDAMACQNTAEAISAEYGILYISGIELNVSFSHPEYRSGKVVSLDILGYQYDINDYRIAEKVRELQGYRKNRAERILENINAELAGKRLKPFTSKDLEAIEETVDGAFGRPHIANYMVRKGIVATRQEAFDLYLVKCNVPKMPLTIEEVSELIRKAGGKVILAHPNDPNGVSLASLTGSLSEQMRIIEERMLPFIDGVECWHSRHDKRTTSSYHSFAREKGLIVTGGSDCHQQPVHIGSVDVPDYVAEQFGIKLE